MSKKIWNKCISLLMVTVMFLTIFVGTGITVAAEHSSANTISTVDISIQGNLLEAGKVYTATEYESPSNITVALGNCTLESIQWETPGGDEIQENEQLSYKDEYKVMISLKANGTDRFDENATVTVNGSDEGVLVVNRDSHGDESDIYDELDFTWTFHPTVKEFVSDFNLSNVPAATPGAAATPYNYTNAVAGGERYNVTGNWYQYNASTQQYESMADTDVFQNDGAYQLVLHADMKPGYVISYDNYPYVLTDNRWVDVEYFDEFGWEASLYESFGTEISEVIFTVPEPTEGQSFSNATPITAAVSSGSKYTVKGNWMEEGTGNYTGTFTKGKAYHFVYTVYAGDGYYLAEDVSMHINDTLHGFLSGNGKTGTGVYRKSMKSLITEVILTDVPKAELGKPFQTGYFAVTVPDGAKYKATGYWRDSAGNEITTGQAETGKEYELWFELQADSGYEFAENYILRINGAAHQSDGGTDSVSYCVRYSFLEQIGQIEVTGMVEPAVGQAPDMSALKSAEPTKYNITQAQWIDLATGALATVFEDGHTYELTVDVVAEPGYEFAPNVSWKLGKESGKGEPYASFACWLMTEYSFAEGLSEIRIDKVPVVEVGEMPQTDISVPADANYTAHAEWRVWNDKTEMWEVFTGTFEKGKSYIMAISVVAKTGYCFEPDVTVCYLDGVLHKEVNIHALQAWVEVIYAPENAKMIHKVELTVSKPNAGDHSSVDPVITLSDGVNYRLRRGALWLEGSIEEDAIFIDRYFEPDGSYGVTFRLIADEGYAFAEDLQVVVNGIIIPAKAFSSEVKTLDIDYFFNMTCQHIYENGKCTVCEATDPNYVSPDTGDKSQRMQWIILFFISGGVVITLTVVDRKRRYTAKH